MIPLEIITAAPDEPDHIKALRARKPRTKLDGSNGNHEKRRVERERIAAAVGKALSAAGFDKLTLKIGPTIYTVWNTKTVLLTLNKKLKP